jgi:hypothetical protein
VADQQIESDTTRTTAHLPGLDIEIVHRRSPQAGAEQISIHLQAVPSFEAFGRFLETANPFAFWARTAQIAWLPWLGAARALMLPNILLAAPQSRRMRSQNSSREPDDDSKMDRPAPEVG